MDITSSYANAIKTVVPGTFVPDVAGSIAPASEPLTNDQVGAVDGTGSFKDAVKSLLNATNDKLATADQKSVDLAVGKSNDLEGTVKSVEEAGLAMEFTMAIRNKLLDAYTEVSRMQF